MKKTILCLSLLLLGYSIFSQHYYRDILVVKAASQKHRLNRTNKVKSIKFLSFDNENKPIEGFSSEQEFSKDFSKVTTRTSTTLTGPTESISWFNTKDQLIKTLDTSESTSTLTSYEYDSKDQLVTITNITSSAGGFLIKEVHKWTYSPQGKPLSMVKIKNDKDTTYIELIADEKGNPAEEKSTLRGKTLPAVYYYYDDEGNLTDIVRYNIAAKRLLPDYIFEYEDNRRLASMLVVPEEGSEYQKWYYSYDEDGLKILDACYSKTKVLIGRIEYQYTYY